MRTVVGNVLDSSKARGLIVKLGGSVAKALSGHDGNGAGFEAGFEVAEVFSKLRNEVATRGSQDCLAAFDHKLKSYEAAELFPRKDGSLEQFLRKEFSVPEIVSRSGNEENEKGFASRVAESRFPNTASGRFGRP